MPPSPLFDPGTDETRRALLDVLEIPIHIVDAQLRVVCANRTIKAWNRTLHLTAEMEGKLLRDVYPFLEDKVYEEYGRVMETGRQLTTEEMTEVGGAARYTETTKIPVLEGKRVVQVVTVIQDVTERRLGEAAVHESRERLSRLVETVPSGITIVNRDGHIVFANQEAEKVLGLTRSEITDRLYNDPAWKITAHDGGPFPDEELPLSRVLATGEPVFGVEHAIEHPDGERALLTINASPLCDAAGELAGMVASVFDITQARAVEKKLNQTSKLLESVLDAIPDVIGVQDRHHRIIRYNKAGYDFLGKTPEEVRGRHCYELMQWDVPCDVCATSEVYETRKPARVEKWVQEMGIWLDARSYPMLDEQGEIVQIIEHLRDITREKQAVEALKERIAFERLISGISSRFINIPIEQIDEEITRSLELIAKFTGAVRSSVFLLSEDGKTITNTHEWCEGPEDSQIEMMQDFPIDTFGFYKSQLMAHRNVVLGKPEDLPHEAVREMEWRAKVGFRPLLFVPMIRENALVGALGFYGGEDERRGWTDDLVSLLRFAADIFVNALERKRADGERARLEEQVRHSQKLESLGVLAGGIAHDFNNLLMGVLGNADLARDDLPAASHARENLASIVQAARKAADLCKQMLAYSGRGRFVVGPIHLSSAVREMAHMLRHAISKKAELDLRLAETLPLVQADASQVTQVVMNLITNASEALQEQPGRVSVSTGTVDREPGPWTGAYGEPDLPGGTYVFLEVADTGAGMDPQVLERLFDPFFTTKFTGRGLGLSAVLGILRGHGGCIAVASEPGRGSTFTVYFPAQEAAAVAETVETAAPVARKPAEATGKRILLADDEDVVRQVGALMLQRLGFDVETAADGQEALDTFRARPETFDCVVLDLTMPRMDGEECFREMRKVRPDVRVLLCSGYDEQEMAERFDGQGMAGFVHKPFDMAILKSKIEEVLHAE